MKKFKEWMNETDKFRELNKNEQGEEIVAAIQKKFRIRCVWDSIIIFPDPKSYSDKIKKYIEDTFNVTLTSKKYQEDPKAIAFDF